MAELMPIETPIVGAPQIVNYKDKTYAELFMDGHRWLDGLSFSKDFKERQRDALAYLEKMANLLEVDISECKILDVFSRRSTPFGSHLIGIRTNKKEINEILSKYQDATRSISDTPTLRGMADSLVKKMIEDQEKERLVLLEKARVELLTERQTLNGHVERLSASMGIIYQNNMKVRKMEGADPKRVFHDLQIISKRRFWKFHEQVGSVIKFSTRDVVLTHVNKNAGINMRVPMGNFLVSFDVLFGELRVLPYNKNIFYQSPAFGRLYHPYINSAGEICWGDATETAANNIIHLRITALFELLASLLSSYSPESQPYASLKSFDEIYRIDNNIPNTETNSSTQRCPIAGCGWDETVDRCDAHSCVVCGDSFESPGADCGCCYTCENIDGECDCRYEDDDDDEENG